MSFLLMVFLTLVCLPEVRDYPEPLLIDTAAASALVTWLGVALVLLHALRVTRRLCGPLERDPSRRDVLLKRYERGRFRHQFMLFGTYLLSLCVFGWGWSVGQFWRHAGGTPILPAGVERVAYLPGVELLVLAPFLVAQFLSWAVFYDAERAAHRAAHRLPDFDPFGHAWLEPQRPAREAPPAFGSRLGYVLFQARQKLALVFIPVVLLLAHKELHRLFPETWESWERVVDFAGMGALLAVFVGMPWIIRLALGLKPLPAGPLRDRLLATARRLRFRYSNILLWNTRSGMANAMVVGILPWLRYVVFTDRLLEDFTEDEVEAVFGHEVGHIRYHHMLYYFAFLSGSMAILAMAGNALFSESNRAAFVRLQEILTDHLGPAAAYLNLGELPRHPSLTAIGMVVCLLLYIFVVFGFLSRRCERQADVFGCRAVSCPGPECWGHDPETALAERGRGLCATGILTFIRALEKVALVNGISRDRPGFLQSWQHSTIARRVAFLQGMLTDPHAEPRFQRRVALVKWTLFVVLGSLFTYLVCFQGGRVL